MKSISTEPSYQQGGRLGATGRVREVTAPNYSCGARNEEAVQPWAALHKEQMVSHLIVQGGAALAQPIKTYVKETRCRGADFPNICKPLTASRQAMGSQTTIIEVIQVHSKKQVSQSDLDNPRHRLGVTSHGDPISPTNPGEWSTARSNESMREWLVTKNKQATCRATARIFAEAVRGRS